MEQDYSKLQDSLITIASEFFRFQGVFEKALGKMEKSEQNKYMSQYKWFSKRIHKALEEAELTLLTVDGQMYDPGMAVSPINIDDFDADDKLYIQQTIEPIIMKNDTVLKTGTVVLGRMEA